MNFEDLKYKGPLAYYSALWSYKIYRYLRYDRFSDEAYLKKLFPLTQGYPLNLEDPKSLNEKIQWLKINDRRPINSLLADKYAVRQFIADHFGEEFLIPLILHTKNPLEITPENLPDPPFVIKLNHDSGNYWIVRDKKEVDWSKLRTDLKWWMSFDYYYHSREHQYSSIEPRIIVERMLEGENGKIPNDYKLHCINGKVAFVYVSVDREGTNKRNIYDRDWIPLPFTFAHKSKQRPDLRGEEISPPVNYGQMVDFAERVAQLYTYIRVDFYDVKGKLYFGEITHHHGSGFDQFRPRDWDYYFGEKLDLKRKVLDDLSVDAL